MTYRVISRSPDEYGRRYFIVRSDGFVVGVRRSRAAAQSDADKRNAQARKGS